MINPPGGKTFDNVKEFIINVKRLEENHGAKVIKDNDNNTLMATINGSTVAQWFNNYGIITSDALTLLDSKPIVQADLISDRLKILEAALLTIANEKKDSTARKIARTALGFTDK